jgi:hypothetical protein
MNNRHTRTIGLVLPLLASAVVAYAAITGVISGTVTDPSGAVIPRVALTATDQLTGVAHTVETDDKGFYSFPALDVGAYTISAVKAGFETFKQTDITVDANSSIRTDIALRIGATTQTEVVVANPAQIDTQSTQVGQVIESTQLTAVPLVTRSFIDLLALQPSVSPYVATSEGGQGTIVSGNLSAGNISINGSREASNGYMVNGVDVDDGRENGAAIIPNLDSLSEFRIITSNFDAQYGNFNGGQVNVVTKSGTNGFHGSAFEFLRNTDFNAANYFNKGVRSSFNQNIYGGTIGGPIKKDKIFFFADFQGTNSTEGTTEEPNVPSTADLTGNVSDLSSLMVGYKVVGNGWASVLTSRLAGVTGQTVVPGEPYYNTDCTNTAASSPTGCVFPGAQIPTAAWDSVPANLFKYIPTAANPMGGVATTLNGLPAVLFTGNPETLSDRKEGLRIDYTTHLGAFFAYYFLDNDSFVNPFSGGKTPEFPAETTGRAQLYNLGLTSTLSSAKVNAFRFGYMRSATHLGIPTYSLPGPSLSSLGFVTPWGTTGGIGNVYPPYAGVPEISINSLEFGTPSTTQGIYDNVFQWIDDFTYVHGTHTFQAGIDFHYNQDDERNEDVENGTFSFADGQETGSGVADFLLGADESFTQSSQQLLDTRSIYLGAYGQDSWRATKDLTLNYGVRYEIITPWWDATNKLETIIPGEQSVVFPGSPVGWVFPGDPGVPRTLAPIKHNKFAPRLGFAYAPQVTGGGFMNKLSGGNNTSIRGSFGIFYINLQDEIGYDEAGDAPYGLFYSSPQPSMLSTPYTLRAAQTIEVPEFPFAWPPTNVSASNPDNNLPWAELEPIGGSPGVSIHNTLPYTEEYTLGIERGFGGSTVLTINYVGSEGRHWPDVELANPGDPALCESLTATVLAAGQTPCGPKLETQLYIEANGTKVYGTRILNQTNGEGLALSTVSYYQTEATSNYNALQVNIKHNSNWGELLVGYTWGKSMDDSSALTDGVYVYNPHVDYALSEYDVPQYLVASYNLHLPFANWVSNHAAKDVVGGWSITGVSKFAKGTPVFMTETDDRSLIGGLAGNNNTNDIPNYTVGNLVGDHNPRNRQPWFNTSLFSKETIGIYGDTMRRFFVGPGLDHTDLAVVRDFNIHESNVFQFRAEAFNFANHAEFSNPNSNIDTASTFGLVSAAVQNQRVLELAVKYHF